VNLKKFRRNKFPIPDNTYSHVTCNTFAVFPSGQTCTRAILLYRSTNSGFHSCSFSFWIIKTTIFCLWYMVYNDTFAGDSIVLTPKLDYLCGSKSPSVVSSYFVPSLACFLITIKQLTSRIYILQAWSFDIYHYTRPSLSSANLPLVPQDRLISPYMNTPCHSPPKNFEGNKLSGHWNISILMRHWRSAMLKLYNSTISAPPPRQSCGMPTQAGDGQLQSMTQRVSPFEDLSGTPLLLHLDTL